MDSPQTVTHISLCAGYGGIDLGLKRAIPNLRTVAFSEIEAFACANLVAKMEAGLLDAAPIWSNLKTFPWAEFCDRVDILSGGYPCQPFSSAGKRLGKEDPRHLWPWIADGIRTMRPRICFFENVEGHISLGLRTVVEELADIGYQTTWGIFSAAEIGAPHQRKRIFILAYRNSAGLPRHWELEQFGLSKGWQTQEGRITKSGGSSSAGLLWPSRPSQPQHGWEPPRVIKSSMGGNTYGSSSGLGYAELCVTCDNRTDELRLLGNGVVPATAQRAFTTLLKETE
jgi:DNA (cytosine-5)-methyltransferase 1